MVTVLRTIPPIGSRVGEMSGGDCPLYDTTHSRQEKRVGEMSGGDCPLYDTSHSSKGEESGRDVRW